MALRTGNPALKAGTFEGYSTTVTSPEARMTLTGTVDKTGILLLFTAGCAGVTWQLFEVNPHLSVTVAWLSALIGALVGFVTIFKMDLSPYTALPYACLEGFFLGAISYIFEAQFPGIVMQAVGGTFGTLLMLLAAYRSGLIKPTENFKLGVVAATGGICALYVVNIIMRFFGTEMAFIHDSGPVGIGFSLFVVAIAAFNLVLDFDFIESGVEMGAPKYLEWYAAFGLLVTLIWLYLELLRLLAKTRSND